MIRHGAAGLMMAGATLLSACASEGTMSPLAGAAPSPPFACPTPSEARITSPYALTGQDLLANSGYVSLMIAHGSLENLERVLASARAEHNAGAARPSDIERLENAIAFRRAAGCPDVPSYAPYDFGDVAFDGIALDLEQP